MAALVVSRPQLWFARMRECTVSAKLIASAASAIILHFSAVPICRLLRSAST